MNSNHRTTLQEVAMGDDRLDILIPKGFSALDPRTSSSQPNNVLATKCILYKLKGTYHERELGFDIIFYINTYLQCIKSY